MIFDRKKIAPILIGLACVSSCSRGPTPEAARAEIEQLGLPFDETGITSAVGTGNNELLRLFLIAGIDPNVQAENTPAPLMLAASRANLVALELLVEAGASAADLPGILTPPATRGNVAALELLLDSGAEIDSIDHLKQSALLASASQGRVETVRFLLGRGASPDGRPGGDLKGATPLLAAVKLGLSETVELLVAGGANLETAGGAPFSTPLILAAQLDRLNIIEVLLAGGADPARSLAGRNAADAARRAGHDPLADRLEQAASN